MEAPLLAKESLRTPWLPAWIREASSEEPFLDWSYQEMWLDYPRSLQERNDQQSLWQWMKLLSFHLTFE